MSKLTINIRAEMIAKYENYIVLVLYMNEKFSKVMTINLNDKKE